MFRAGVKHHLPNSPIITHVRSMHSESVSSHTVAGYRYLNRLITPELNNHVLLDLVGTNGKPNLSAQQLSNNLRLYMMMRRYLRLTLVGPNAKLDGVVYLNLGVSNSKLVCC